MANYQDDSLVKRAHTLVGYTSDQIENLKKCFDDVSGPEFFMKNYMYVQHAKRGKIKFEPYPFQIGLIDTYHNYTKSISMCSRQLGKSTVAAGYLLWYAMFKPDSTILIASYKFDSAQDIMDRVKFAYESVPDYIRAGVKIYNKRSVEFDNGSKIIATTTTENTGRGMSLSLIYLDELSFVAPNIAKPFYTSLSPTLSTGGKCIITATPNTDEDQFAEIWFGANKLVDADGNETSTGPNGFRPFKAIWSDHPDRDQAWADAQLADLKEDRFRREHLCLKGSTVVEIETRNNETFAMSLESLYNVL